MIEELELRGMSAATKKSYLTCCRLFVAHFMKSPEQLGADDIKAFLLSLMRERKVGPSCVRGYIAAISFLYHNVLRNPGVVEDLPYPRVPKTLPDVLSREEVQQLLGTVRSTIHRTILMVAYGAGLRISEALRRKPLTGRVMAGRRGVMKTGVDANQAATSRKARISPGRRAPVLRLVRNAAIGTGCRPSARG
jgi:site-specific recombinase XerD